MTGHDHHVYLLIGSNISPEEHVRQALLELCHYGILNQVSQAWQTPAFGSQGPDFINLAVELITTLDLDTLKDQALTEIEMHLGRVRTSDKNAPRTIDIDIILYDGNLLDPTLWTRVHTAVVMAELLPDLVHPTDGRSLAEIAAELAHGQPLRRRPDVFNSS